ncbi:conserved exported hypothetical protein [Tenacibaculum litopenaei]|uniref:hypothetical protein n=1 Tax=Tenacibaculum litopenaei TaxID=396016 RepID=UPI003894BE41
MKKTLLLFCLTLTSIVSLSQDKKYDTLKKSYYIQTVYTPPYDGKIKLFTDLRSEKAVKFIKKNDTIKFYGMHRFDKYGNGLIVYDYHKTFINDSLYYFNLLSRITMEYIKDANLIQEYTKKEKSRLDSISRIEKMEAEALRKKSIINECHYYKNERDEFTGVYNKYTDTYNLDDFSTSAYGEVRIELRKIDNSKFIWFHLNQDLGCAVSYRNRRSFVKVKLKNNQIVSFYHFGDTDCGDFSIVAKLTNSDISKLKKSPIKSIRFSGTKYYHDVKMVTWDTFFIDKLDCIK